MNRLVTSDDYLLSKLDTADLFELAYRRPRTLREKVSGTMTMAAEKLFIALWTRLESARY